MPQKRFRRLIWVVLWVVAVLFPMAWVLRTWQPLNDLFNMIFHPWWMHIIMHALQYAGLVLLIAWAFELKNASKHFIIVLAIVLGAGLMQEVLQTLLQGRFITWAEVFDLGVDVCGGLLGWGLWVVFQHKRLKLNAPKNQKTEPF